MRQDPPVRYNNLPPDLDTRALFQTEGEGPASLQSRLAEAVSLFSRWPRHLRRPAVEYITLNSRRTPAAASVRADASAFPLVLSG